MCIRDRCNGDDYEVNDTLTCYSYWGTCDEHDNYRATLTGNDTGVSVAYIGDFAGTSDSSVADADDDQDGVSDADDACPLDIDESVDTEGDGV